VRCTGAWDSSCELCEGEQKRLAGHQWTSGEGDDLGQALEAESPSSIGAL
jgi:hypothetical protein